jgi:hypothetical protein
MRYRINFQNQYSSAFQLLMICLFFLQKKFTAHLPLLKINNYKFINELRHYATERYDRSGIDRHC